MNAKRGSELCERFLTLLETATAETQSQNPDLLVWSDEAQEKFLERRGFSSWFQASDEAIQEAIEIIVSACRMFGVDVGLDIGD